VKYLLTEKEEKEGERAGGSLDPQVFVKVSGQRLEVKRERGEI